MPWIMSSIIVTRFDLVPDLESLMDALVECGPAFWDQRTSN